MINERGNRGLSPIYDWAEARRIAEGVAGVDSEPGSQDKAQSYWHHMCGPGERKDQCAERFADLVKKWETTCDERDFWRAVHATQDSYSPAHNEYETWWGMPSAGWQWPMLSVWVIPHIIGDATGSGRMAARRDTVQLIQKWKEKCGCTH